MEKLKTHFRFKKIVARLFAGVMFPVCLGNTFPLVAAATLLHDDSCQMACCKGRLRHSAKGCSGGSCHLKPAKKAVPSEQLCGGQELTEKRLALASRKNVFVRTNPIDVPIYDASAETNSHESGGLPSLAHKLADNDCQTLLSVGSGGSFGGGQQRQPSAGERAALVSFSVRPRPPSLSPIRFYQTQLTFARRLLTRQLPARAPPIFFS